MTEIKGYRCINCGKPAAALFKTYGPSVLKLSKCEHCKGVVDKYIEYDPVIVMIDLILISKEAQRHILYNTEFKWYWKLVMAVALLDTYSAWSRDGLLPAAVHSLGLCPSANTTTTLLLRPPWPWVATLCADLGPPPQPPAPAPFVWEKDFYMHFVATVIGIAVFIVVVHWGMTVLSPGSARVSVPLVLGAKALSIGGAYCGLRAGVLVWGARALPATRALHHALVAGYALRAHSALLHVVYGARWLQAVPLLLLAAALRLAASTLALAAPWTP